MKNPIRFSALLCLLLVAVPLSAYTVYLKDGSRLIAKSPPEIRGDMAIITLQNGTEASISASEIDVARTRDANQGDLGSALVLEGGEFTDRPREAPKRREKRLSDVARRGSTTGSGAAGRSPRAAPGSKTARDPQADLRDWQRKRYRDLEIASEVQGVFRGQGIEEARLFEGTAVDRILVDLTTDSEAAVFRGLRVAAAALTQLQSSFPGEVSALEIVMLTSSRSRAGQFLIDVEAAEHLLASGTEISSFYVENVRF